MKTVILLAVVIVAVSADSVCYKDAMQACNPSDSKPGTNTLTRCNAKYGGIEHVKTSLQQLVNTHITRSFEYLLMSTHYANYQKNREGFEKMFRSYSDSKWSDAIDIIKYLTKRGVNMDFNMQKEDKLTEKGALELDELQSMAKALDIEKDLAADVQIIHAHATRPRENKDASVHDPEITSYLEEHFAHKLSDNVRSLSGHASDLAKLLTSQSDSSLSVFLFDEYLQKL